MGVFWVVFAVVLFYSSATIMPASRPTASHLHRFFILPSVFSASLIQLLPAIPNGLRTISAAFDLLSFSVEFRWRHMRGWICKANTRVGQ
jgi:hypothetical protein